MRKVWMSKHSWRLNDDMDKPYHWTRSTDDRLIALIKKYECKIFTTNSPHIWCVHFPPRGELKEAIHG